VRTAIVVLASGTLLVGCSSLPERPLDPSIGTIAVAETVQGVEPVVTVQVVVPEPSGARIERVSLRFRSTDEPDRPFVDADEEASSVPGGSGYRGTLPALNYGDYEVEVTATLGTFDPADAPSSAPNTILTKTHPFSVGADAVECFSVDSGFDDWTFDGFYEGDVGPVAPNCAASPLVTAQGTAAVVFGPCLPANPAVTEWRFDVVSPTLTDRPGWSETDRVLVRAMANAQVRMTPLLLAGSPPTEVASPDVTTFGAGNATSTYLDFAVSVPVPDGAPVSGARLRFAVESPGATQDGAVTITTVCPTPNRPR
jgi:hypothetical protein